MAWSRPRIGLLLIVVTILIGLFWIGDTDTVLEYLKVLLWPCVVGGSVWILREPLRRKLGQLTGFSAAGAAATFEGEKAATADLEQGVNQAVNDLGVDIAPEAVTNEPSGDATEYPSVMLDEDHATQPAEAAPRTPPDDQRQRQAITQLIQKGAEWGFEMARLGHPRLPVTQVAWNDDGNLTLAWDYSEPAVSYRGTGAWKARSPHRSERIANLEDEVRRLEKERWADPLLRNPGILTQIEEAKKKLRSVYPQSGLL